MADNRFDFLRLAFASAVFGYHMVLLALLPSQWAIELWASFAEISVQGFFVVSGALVYGSLKRSSDLSIYAEKRIRRLYPAYAVIVLVPAFYALFKTGALGDVARYLGANLVFLNFLEPNLPELFQNQIVSAVNGSLWTLKIEVMFYLILPLLSWLLTKSGKAVFATIIVIYVGAEVWRTVFEWMALKPLADGGPAQNVYLKLARQLPGQMSFFISGIALWMLRAYAKQYWHIALLLGASLMTVSYFWAFEPLRACGLSVLIAAIAYAPGARLSVGRYGDISYGVYITHFPIVQALVAAGLFEYNRALGAIVAVGLVFVSSFALWRLIERPMLRTDSHYKRSASI